MLNKDTEPDSNVANGGSVGIGTTLYDTSTLTGATANAGGTVTYYVEKGDATCSIAGATSLGTKNVASGVVPQSDDFTVTSAGTYYFWAVYSGDAANDGATSGCDTEVVVVNANRTTISTQVKNDADDSNIADGATSRSAPWPTTPPTLDGNTANAGGTATYYVEKGDATCSIAGATSLGTEERRQRRGAGLGQLHLHLGRDLRVLGRLLGRCQQQWRHLDLPSETVIVDANRTTISTQVKNDADDSNIADGAHVAIGTVAYDTADLDGNTANAGGTATYYVEKGDATCSIAGATSLGTKNVASGVVPDSDNYTFTSAGTYEFWAVYSGDANNDGATSTCLSETVIVDANRTTISTQVKNDADDSNIADGAHVAIGTVAYDTADLDGNTANAGGTATYYVEKGDATCSIAGATSLGTKNVASGVVPDSDNYTFTSAGTYEFWVVYSGDANNDGATSTCLSETVIVDANRRRSPPR